MASDPLGEKISAEVTVSDGGVKAEVKSRAAAAFDRLLGAGADYFAARIEGQTEVLRARNKGNVAAIEILSNKSNELVAADLEMHKIAFERFRDREVRETQNIKRIAEKSSQILRDTGEISANSDLQEPINDDWLNLFESFAAKASTERMQELMSKILAGEIRKSNSFSLSTLRMCAELDAHTANIFQSVVFNRLSLNAILKDSLMNCEIKN